ncbi:MAG TPA: TetR/AcrR family transcriptional regulator [Longimicrobiales bacterium]|nr:TetR/AcrR family transcriptional regulator [Longimicrobiales bacterium]
MPPALATKTEVLDRIMDSFRKHGYDGASLATISERTGLGKSSLYHHFPGGKEQMAIEVLAHLSAALRPTFQAVEDEPNPKKKLGIMLDAIDAFYDGGKKACLLERLGASVDRARFGAPLRDTFTTWMSVLASICRAAGLSAAIARRRAEGAIVRIEGALVVAAGTGDPSVFGRTLNELRATLLVPEPRKR